MSTVYQRTIYMTFRGFCMHCGNPVGQSVHGDDGCNMEGAELRLTLLGMAFNEWLKVERAERVIKAADEYLAWPDADTKQDLVDAMAFYTQGGTANG